MPPAGSLWAVPVSASSPQARRGPVKAAPAPPRAARRGFVWGWLCGVVYFAGTIYWTGGVMARYGGIQPAPAAAIAALPAEFLADGLSDLRPTASPRTHRSVARLRAPRCR